MEDVFIAEAFKEFIGEEFRGFIEFREFIGEAFKFIEDAFRFIGEVFIAFKVFIGEEFADVELLKGEFDVELADEGGGGPGGKGGLELLWFSPLLSFPASSFLSDELEEAESCCILL